MLDHRFQTFLTLCETGNYTKTAEKLNLTQPAVSQHIKFLEEYYQVELVANKGRNFSLTEEGEVLQSSIRTLNANSKRIFSLLSRIKSKTKPLNFGATLTIGEYMLPSILDQIMKSKPETEILMYVENTQILQEMLWDGKIDFALLEGYFNRSEFESKLISDEQFIGVCAPNNKIANQTNTVESLLKQNLIVREPGSGTRDILEQAIYNQNLRIKDFKSLTVIGNMNTIKHLCHQNRGITFMYREAVKNEIATGYLKEIPLQNFDINHPFNFVYLAGSPNQARLEYWFNEILRLRHLTSTAR